MNDQRPVDPEQFKSGHCGRAGRDQAKAALRRTRSAADARQQPRHDVIGSRDLSKVEQNVARAVIQLKKQMIEQPVRTVTGQLPDALHQRHRRAEIGELLKTV